MASIHKRNGRRFWYASWRDLTGKQKLASLKIPHTPEGKDPGERARKAADNRRRALEAATALEEADRGCPVEAQLRKLVSDISEKQTGRRIEFPTVKKYVLEWLEGKDLKPRTRARYQKPIKDFIATLGSRAALPLSGVTPADFTAFARARLQSGKSPVTVRTDLKAVGQPFLAAYRAGLILTNPAAGAEKFDATSEQREPFTRQEVEALLAATASTEWETLIGIAAFAGLRLGDAAKLTWGNVDLFSGTLNFRPKKTDRKKRDLCVPIGRRLLEHLKTLSPGGAEDPIMPELAGKPVGGTHGLSLIFEDIMSKARIDRGKVEAKAGGRAFYRKSFHSLRHFFISELERAGVAPDLRQKLAGHSSAEVHARYTHTDLDTLRKAVEGL
jgi:integrase